MTKKLNGKSTIGLCAVVLTASACGTFSGPRSGDVERRLYVGAGALVSDLEPDTSERADVRVSESQSAGGSLTVGYDVFNRVSIEGTIASLGEAELSVDSGEDSAIDYQTAGLSAVFYGLNSREGRARREGFSVFGRLGAGTLENDSDIDFDQVNDFHVIAGVGAEYGFRNGLGVRGEFVGHDTDATFLQLGLVYRFGDAAGSRTRPLSDDRADGARPSPVPAPSGTISSSPLDSDTDGVPDNVDQCRDTAIGSPVDATGCDVFGGAIEGVNFESGSDRLTDGALAELDSVAATLSRYPEVSVLIDAHTDNTGDAEANLQLSRRRAIAVARYLVEQGIAGDRLRPRAFGESRPRNSNATAEGRAANRRVEFSVAQ